MFCNHCGKEILSETCICPHCGKVFSSAAMEFTPQRITVLQETMEKPVNRYDRLSKIFSIVGTVLGVILLATVLAPFAMMGLMYLNKPGEAYIYFMLWICFCYATYTEVPFVVATGILAIVFGKKSKQGVKPLAKVAIVLQCVGIGLAIAFVVTLIGIGAFNA